MPARLLPQFPAFNVTSDFAPLANLGTKPIDVDANCFARDSGSLNHPQGKLGGWIIPEVATYSHLSLGPLLFFTNAVMDAGSPFVGTSNFTTALDLIHAGRFSELSGYSSDPDLIFNRAYLVQASSPLSAGVGYNNGTKFLVIMASGDVLQENEALTQSGSGIGSTSQVLAGKTVSPNCIMATQRDVATDLPWGPSGKPLGYIAYDMVPTIRAGNGINNASADYFSALLKVRMIVTAVAATLKHQDIKNIDVYSHLLVQSLLDLQRFSGEQALSGLDDLMASATRIADIANQDMRYNQAYEELTVATSSSDASSRAAKSHSSQQAFASLGMFLNSADLRNYAQTVGDAAQREADSEAQRAEALATAQRLRAQNEEEKMALAAQHRQIEAQAKALEAKRASDAAAINAERRAEEDRDAQLRQLVSKDSPVQRALVLKRFDRMPDRIESVGIGGVAASRWFFGTSYFDFDSSGNLIDSGP
jgi:hypothetical protein